MKGKAGMAEVPSLYAIVGMMLGLKRIGWAWRKHRITESRTSYEVGVPIPGHHGKVCLTTFRVSGEFHEEERSH